MGALIWLVAALALAGAEALTGDLFLLMLSGGALSAAGASAVFGGNNERILPPPLKRHPAGGCHVTARAS